MKVLTFAGGHDELCCRYGGHVTDAFDRRLVTAYLEAYLFQELLDGFQVRCSRNFLQLPDPAFGLKNIWRGSLKLMPSA
jgi:hypothetical protein